MRVVVGVLRGGPSSEYDVSLKSGASILEHLDRERFEPRDLFVDRQGAWHHHGLPIEPHQALRHVDVVFNAIHGNYGEDGTVQKLLDAHGVRYTGPKAFEAALAFNKHLTREAVKPLGIRTALGTVVARLDEESLKEEALRLFRSMVMPVIVKPVVGGSSVGMSVARDALSLLQALRKALDLAPKALVEQFIRGREATVGVIDDFRGERTYVLPPVEIVPPENSPFFDYDSKYGGASREICPGNFSAEEKHALMDLARRVHEGLGLLHYSRSDFIVTKRGIYFLEVNSAPAIGLTEQSLFPKALAAVGSKPSEFFEHVINLALR